MKQSLDVEVYAGRHELMMKAMLVAKALTSLINHFPALSLMPNSTSHFCYRLSPTFGIAETVTYVGSEEDSAQKTSSCHMIQQSLKSIENAFDRYGMLRHKSIPLAIIRTQCCSVLRKGGN
nr:hypothetical protein CFP56_56528 [Quercus suber]